MSNTTEVALLDRLREIDTCAVSDVLEQLRIPGTVVGLKPLSAPRRIVGRAITVQLGPVDSDTPPARHLCSAAVDAGTSENVIVVANDGRTQMASWGGLLSTGAHHRGVAGVVIDGAARDIDEAADLDFPIFALAPTPVTARAKVVEKSWNTPVSLGDVPVSPDDVVMADRSGVVVIPADRLAEVVDKAESMAAREREMARLIAAGRPISEVMGLTYEQMLENDND